jgi:hypothetical protein
LPAARNSLTSTSTEAGTKIGHRMVVKICSIFFRYKYSMVVLSSTYMYKIV